MRTTFSLGITQERDTHLWSPGQSDPSKIVFGAINRMSRCIDLQRHICLSRLAQPRVLVHRGEPRVLSIGASRLIAQAPLLKQRRFDGTVSDSIDGTVQKAYCAPGPPIDRAIPASCLPPRSNQPINQLGVGRVQATTALIPSWVGPYYIKYGNPNKR